MFRRLNYLIIGVLVGLLLAGSLAFAQPLNEYILKQVTYPIIVDGQEYVNDELPILNYNGTTYVPLKEVSNLLGADVSWDDEQNQIFINKEDSKGENNDMQINTTGNIIETTFKGLQAIKVDGEVYFQAVDFNRKMENMELLYNDQSKLTTLVDLTTDLTISEIPIKDITIYNGRTYIPSHFYPNTATMP